MALVTKLFQKINNYTDQIDISTYNLYENDYVNCMISYNNIVYIGGSFTKIINNLDSVIVNNVFMYNSLNNRIIKMQGGVNNIVNKICVDSYGNAYIVGNFTRVYDSSYNEIYDNCGNSIKYLVKWDYSNNVFDYVINDGYFNYFSGNILSCDIFDDKYLYLGNSGFNNINIDNDTRYVYIDGSGYLYPPHNQPSLNLLLIYLDDDKTKIRKIGMQIITTSIDKIKVLNNQNIYLSSNTDLSGFVLLKLSPHDPLDLSGNMLSAELLFNGHLYFFLPNTLNTYSNNNITCNTNTHYDFTNGLIDRNVSLDAYSNLYKLKNTSYDISGVIDFVDMIDGSGIYHILGSGDLDVNTYYNITPSYSDGINVTIYPVAAKYINFNTTIYSDLSCNLIINPNSAGSLNYTDFIFNSGTDGIITMQFIDPSNNIFNLDFIGNIKFDVNGSFDISNNIIDLSYNQIHKYINILYYDYEYIEINNQVNAFYVDTSDTYHNVRYYGGVNIFYTNTTPSNISIPIPIILDNGDTYNNYVINDIIPINNLYNTTNKYLYLIGYFKSTFVVDYPYVSIFLYNITLNTFSIYDKHLPIYNNRYNITSIMNCGVLTSSIFNSTDLLAGGLYLSYYDFKQYYTMINYLQKNNLILANAAINLIDNLIHNNITHDVFSTQIGYIFKSYLSIIKKNNKNI